MCWEIRVDAGGFLMGVIMAQCYSITKQFKAMAPGAELRPEKRSKEVQRAEFSVPCDMQKSHVVLAGLNH